MAELEQDLATHTIVGVDTSPFIYLWEQHPRYFPLSETLFRHLKSPDVVGITSIISVFYLHVQSSPQQPFCHLWRYLRHVGRFEYTGSALMRIISIPIFTLSHPHPHICGGIRLI